MSENKRTREHIYKDDIIVEFPDGQFLATTLDIEGDPIEKTCNSLKAAQRWIDEVEKTNQDIAFEASER